MPATEESNTTAMTTAQHTLFFVSRSLCFGEILGAMMPICKTVTPAPGTRDFAKEQVRIRKKTFSIIEDVFERHGATALDTSVFELRHSRGQIWGRLEIDL